MRAVKILWILTLLCLVSCNENPVPELTKKVFIYEKSNWDGSNKGKIAVYYEEAHKIESFKWHEGNQEATIVRAWLDSLNHTVTRFEAYRVNDRGQENLSATLQALPTGSLEVRFGDFHQEFNDPPKQWHSYDFDFASLGYAYRWLRTKGFSHTFHIVDIDLKKSPPELADFGRVTMNFHGEEKIGNHTVSVYRIDGEGLDHRGGTIRFDKDLGYLHSFEIEKPDEPGYTNGKLLLKSVTKMDTLEWADFKYRQLNPLD